MREPPAPSPERLRQQSELSQSVPPRGLVKVFNPPWSVFRGRELVVLAGALLLVVAFSIAVYGFGGSAALVAAVAMLVVTASLGVATVISEQRRAKRRGRDGPRRHGA